MADDRRTPRLAAAYCAAADEWYHIAGRDTGATTTAEHIAIRMSEAVLAADPLRALLADEDRAVEFVTEVRWNAKEARMQDEFGRTPRPWTSVANYPGKAWRPCCENWRAETRKVFGPVLAALREVAGNG